MKKIVLCLCCLGAMILSAVEYPVEFNPEPKSPRIIKVGKTPIITLAANGKSSVEIVRTDPNVFARTAASDLAKFLGEITGTELKVLAKASGTVPAIYVGQSEIAKKAGLDTTELEGDGYYIKTVGKDICILGTDRVQSYRTLKGTMFGVYEFLERFCGVRFYFPGVGTVVPKHKTLTLPEIDITDRPDDMMRFAYISDMSKHLMNEIPDFYNTGFSKKQISDMRNFWRYSELLPHIPHGMDRLNLSLRFGKEHPEYFALHNGVRVNGINIVNWPGASKHAHPCFSSEELREELYKDCAAVLTKQTASRGLDKFKLDGYSFTPPLVAIMPPDALLSCQCEKCKKYDTPKKQSDLIWGFMMYIAKKLKDEKIPGYFGIYAYAQFSNVPENVEIPDNVVFMLASGSPWNDKLRQRRESYDKLVEGWCKKINRSIFAWVYPGKTCALVPYFPNVTPKISGQFLKRHVKNIRGWFWEAESDRWLFSALDAYLMCKMAWDNSADPEDLYNEYLQTMFGPASGTMKEFYAVLEKAWLEILSDTFEFTYGPRWKLTSEYDIWQNIYSEQVIKRVNALLDKAEKLAAADKDNLERVKFIRRTLWQEPVVNVKKRFIDKQSFDSLFSYNVAQKRSAITVDGNLTEQAWHRVPACWLISADGTPNEVNTSIKILQDSENYYLAIEAEEPLTDNMVILSNKDDDGKTWQDNCIELFFYPSVDADYYWQLIVNSKNGKSDFRGSADRKVFDISQNSNWKTAVKVNKGKNWTAEVCIPKSFMPDVTGDTIRASFQRFRYVKNGNDIIKKYYIWKPRRTLSAREFAVLNIGAPDASKIYGEYMDARPWLRKTANGNVAYIGFWYSQHDKIYRDDEIFLSGGASIRLQSDCDRVRFSVDKLKPSTRYKISYVVKHENVERTSEFYMIMYWGPGNFSSKDRLSGTAPWTRYEYEFTTPATRKYSILEFNCRNTKTGKVWIDSMEIREVK